MKKFRVEIHVDPPENNPLHEGWDYVTICAESESKKSLEWLIKYVEDRIQVVFPIEQFEDKD